jgi:tRNA A-37 threonylcarbamoyl transferase component Bud32
MRSRKHGVAAPCVYYIDYAAKRIYMSLIEGVTLKAWLLELVSALIIICTNPRASSSFTIYLVQSCLKLRNCKFQPGEGELQKIIKAVGSCVGRLHDADVVHGDLTSSNILVTGTSKVKNMDVPDEQDIHVSYDLARHEKSSMINRKV